MTLVLRSFLVLSAVLLLAAAGHAQDADESAADGSSGTGAELDIKPADLPPEDQTRQVLSEILAQPEFSKDGEDSKPGKSLLERINEWLNGLFGNQSWFGGMGWPGVGLVIALLCAVIYLLVRLYLGFSRTRSVRSAEAEPEQLPTSAEALINLSREAASIGDFRRAVRLLFNAAVKRLDMPSSSLQTNYQMLAFTRRNHLAAVSTLKQLITIFEDVWYGAMPCGQSEYSQSEQLYRNFAASIYREEK